MAQKRMFALSVVDTDKFMDMPVSAQALYFHLGLHGDDDGFVAAPKKIARAAGCNDDDLRLLVSKGYLIPFKSGVVVITDWRVNNTLKNDRYHATIYQDEMQSLLSDDSGRYVLGNNLEPSRNHNGSNLEPEHNITEHSITKHREDIEADKPHTCSTSDFDLFWNAYPKKVGKQAAKKAFSRVKVPVETLLTAIDRQKCSTQWSKDGGQYIPNPATWLNQGRWEDELEQVRPSSANQNQRIPGIVYC